MGLDDPIHVAFLFVILLLVFGAKRLPDMGRSLGLGLRGFKEAISGESTPEPVEHLPVATRPETSGSSPSHEQHKPPVETADAGRASGGVDLERV